jgi:hypothetical protein
MEAWDLRILGDVGGSSALNPMPAEEQPQILRLRCASLRMTALSWCGEKTTTRTTADPSTPLRFVQDDSFVLVRRKDNDKNNRRSFDSAALRSG